MAKNKKKNGKIKKSGKKKVKKVRVVTPEEFEKAFQIFLKNRNKKLN